MHSAISYCDTHGAPNRKIFCSFATCWRSFLLCTTYFHCICVQIGTTPIFFSNTCLPLAFETGVCSIHTRYHTNEHLLPISASSPTPTNVFLHSLPATFQRPFDITSANASFRAYTCIGAPPQANQTAPYISTLDRSVPPQRPHICK